MVDGRRRTRHGFRAIPLIRALCLLLGSLLVSAPSFAVSPRTTLTGHIPRLVASSKFIDHVAPGEQVSLALTLPLRSRPELTSLVSSLYDRTSAMYGKYLTPDEFAVRFGPTQADYDALVSFVRSQGLTVVNTHSNRAVLDVAGAASAVESAFAVVLNHYKAPDNRVFRAPDREPSVPSALAGKLSGIGGLDTAAVRHHYAVRRSQAPHASTLGGTGPLGGLSPSDFKTAYNLSTTKLKGSGQTLAVFELDSFAASDVANYESSFGLSAPTLQTVTVDGGISSSTQGGQDEVTLDIELQIAVAPGASKILVYEGPNTDAGVIDMYNRIATDDLALQSAATWGLDEADTGTTSQNAENSAFIQMAAQGQSMFAAGGDEGAYDNYGVYNSNGVLETPVICVDDPASQPYVTAVGGTTVYTNGAGGGRTSETTWNDGLTGGAGGGGISQYWSIPSYQVGVGSSASGRSTTMRNVPDVALNADPNNGYSIYSGGTWVVYGGTSCAAPLYSGIAALINQQRLANGDPVLGFANPSIYSVAESSRYSSTFHDIADNSNNLYYHAVTGYDLATGWGSPNGASLIAALAPVRFDQTGTGYGGFLLRNKTDNTLNYWLMNGTTITSTGTIGPTVSSDWQVVARPDLNGDGYPDIVWQDRTAGAVTYWLMNGTTYTSWAYIITGLASEWKLVGAADMDRDGNSDLIFENTLTGDVTYLKMLGTQWTGTWGYLVRNVPLQWEIVGVVDLTGDGSPDLVWWNSQTGDVTYYEMSGTTFTGIWNYIVKAVPTQWQPVGLMDVTGDGDPDIIWQNTNSGDITYYALVGTTWSGTWGTIAHPGANLVITGLR